MITGRDLRSGIAIEMDGGLFMVLETQHVKRENRRAIVRTKLKNLQTGVITDTALRPEDVFKQAYIELKKMQYLYSDDAAYYFMDQLTYEEVGVTKSIVGDDVKFIKEGMEVTASVYNNAIVSITLPPFVNLKVSYTEPGIKGDTAKGGSKPATIETGAVIKVPLFINTNDVIKIDTRTGEYAGRV